MGVPFGQVWKTKDIGYWILGRCHFWNRNWSISEFLVTSGFQSFVWNNVSHNYFIKFKFNCFVWQNSYLLYYTSMNNK